MWRARRARYANILVTGGDEHLRAGVVSRIENSSDSSRPVCRVAIPQDEAALRSSLRCWLGLASGRAPIPCDHGTLFIEGVLHSPSDLQHLLLQLADRLALGSTTVRGVSPGPERIAAGLDLPADAELPRGSLISALLDRVDKLRVDLGPAPHWSG